MPAYVAAQSLDEVLATSDVVIMAASLNPESRGMLDLDALRRMKPDVVFVNITRGGIVPDDTLAALAQSDLLCASPSMCSTQSR
ncbi:NAD(P)-dependent oxidoreductase [Azospirillum sp. INR13]|uniref:NAD(P)-dependent oxidoreductase n=1 Tax=Azospirillum sp. INR13 TaxID=2596919 RepID=UPI0021048F13|nr:NAD(P)-dependent oxidoreductase [Azospirillum sp. INR13]